MHWVVSVAKEYEEVDLGYGHSFPVSATGGNIYYADLIIEFEEKSDDIFKDASEALKEYINKVHPGMDYRYYYWTLEPREEK